MSMIENQPRTRQGTCPAHGEVIGEKQVPKLKFPFVVSGIARKAALMRPYRCPDCGAKVS